MQYCYESAHHHCPFWEIHASADITQACEALFSYRKNRSRTPLRFDCRVLGSNRACHLVRHRACLTCSGISVRGGQLPARSCLQSPEQSFYEFAASLSIALRLMQIALEPTV